jgi:hypothetical protein
LSLSWIRQRRLGKHSQTRLTPTPLDAEANQVSGQ